MVVPSGGCTYNPLQRLANMSSVLDISVIIITHNRERRIIETIKSILRNTHVPKEIIVIYDGVSEDLLLLGLKPFLRGKNPKFVYRHIHPARGVSYSRSVGISLATGSVVGFIDDDCYASKDWIHNIWKAFVDAPQVYAITGHIKPSFPENYWNRVLYTFHADRPYVKRQTHFLFGANYFFRLSVFRKFGVKFYTKTFLCSEDRYISFLMDQKNLRMMYVPNVLVNHDFRQTLQQVAAQWHRYGVCDYYFWKIAPKYHTNDADYFRTRSFLSIILHAPIRVPRQIFRMIRDTTQGMSSMPLVPGLICLFVAYFFGVYQATIYDRFFQK